MQVRARQAEQELAKALDEVAERDEQWAQVEGLREALNSAQDVTGEGDIKKVLQDYQRRELEASAHAGRLLQRVTDGLAAEASLQDRCNALSLQLQVLSVCNTSPLNIGCDLRVHKVILRATVHRSQLQGQHHCKPVHSV